jgi:hypothetical protein
MPERLEYVRRALGISSVKEFYHEVRTKALNPDTFPGYEAALTYHSRREAPAQYLAAVEALSGYRMYWVATGEGSPGDDDPKLEVIMDSRLRYYFYHSPHNQRLLRGLVEDALNVLGPDVPSDELTEQLVGVIWYRIVEPFAYVTDSADEMEAAIQSPLFQAYASAELNALHLAMVAIPRSRSTGSGDEVRNRLRRWIGTWRVPPANKEQRATREED